MLYEPVALTVIKVVVDELGAVTVGQTGTEAGKLVASGWLSKHQLYVRVPVGVVLAPPSRVKVEDVFGKTAVPAVPEPSLIVFVGIVVLVPLLAKASVCGVGMLFKLAVGAVLETVSVCETGTLIPRVEAVTCTWDWPPAGVVG